MRLGQGEAGTKWAISLLPAVDFVGGLPDARKHARIMAAFGNIHES
jgi:hypothetical protein